MAWVAGTVSVDDSENVTGSGQALALFNDIYAEETADNPLPSLIPDDDWDGTPAAWVAFVKPIRVKMLKAWARQARALAKMATYATANVEVTVTIPNTGAGAGLQRTPSPNDPLTATVQPASPKNISGVIE